MYKKVLFTQFAIPSYDTLEYRSNVHLAAGYLLAYARDSVEDTDFVVTPRIYTDILNENAYIDYVLEQKPDLLVFTLYLWNIEKSLRIVAKLKELLVNAEFLFGGPEVNPDNEYLLKSDVFEQGIVGEGEVSFRRFLMGEKKELIPGYLTKASFNSEFELRKDFTVDNNPYLQNLIEIKPDKTLFFETVRGCPFSCNFCYYNKVYEKVSPVAHDQLEEIFNYAREHDFEELFLLDPTFNIQPNFDQLLDKLIELNHDKKFRISTELRADYLSDEQIGKLVSLNVKEVEIGLQTSNPQALEAMGRANRIEETIERTKKMIAAGIDCKVDLIIALPGDNLDGFKKSIDDVVKHNIAGAIQVFRLSLLSGTEFSKNRSELRLQAQKEAPYYLQSTPNFSESDIRDAIEYAEDNLDITFYPVPAFLLAKDFTKLDGLKFSDFDSDIKAVHKIVVKNNDFDLGTIENSKRKLCETLVVHFLLTGSREQQLNVLKSISYLYANYPNNNFQFVLEYTDFVDCDFLIEFSELIPRRTLAYLDRDSYSNLGVDFNLSSAMAVIAPLKFMKQAEYDSLKEQCELYIRIEHFDESVVDELYEDSKLFFAAGAQDKAFEYLSEKNKLDEYTVFDSFNYELRKNDDIRVYKANIVEI